MIDLFESFDDELLYVEDTTPAEMLTEEEENEDIEIPAPYNKWYRINYDPIYSFSGPIPGYEDIHILADLIAKDEYWDELANKGEDEALLTDDPNNPVVIMISGAGHTELVPVQGLKLKEFKKDELEIVPDHKGSLDALNHDLGALCEEENLDEEAFNIGSNKNVEVGSEPYKRIKAVCDKLNKMNLVDKWNGKNVWFDVKETYEDYGANMLWKTIICQEADGSEHQILDPKEWMDIANGDISADEAIKGIMADEYCQFKELDEMEESYNRSIHRCDTKEGTQTEDVHFDLDGCVKRFLIEHQENKRTVENLRRDPKYKKLIESIESQELDAMKEDIVKQDGKWVNKGEEGTHGKFKTKKAARQQQKAMYANGYKGEALEEANTILGLEEDWDDFTYWQTDAGNKPYDHALRIQNFDADLWGMDEDEFQDEVVLYDEQPCKAELVVDNGTKDQREDYYDLEFKDGHTLSAVSGFEIDFGKDDIRYGKKLDELDEDVEVVSASYGLTFDSEEEMNRAAEALEKQHFAVKRPDVPNVKYLDVFCGEPERATVNSILNELNIKFINEAVTGQTPQERDAIRRLKTQYCKLHPDGTWSKSKHAEIPGKYIEVHHMFNDKDLDGVKTSDLNKVVFIVRDKVDGRSPKSEVHKYFDRCEAAGKALKEPIGNERVDYIKDGSIRSIKAIDVAKLAAAGKPIYESKERDLAEAESPAGYAPKKTGKAYKVFRVKNGKLYPPMVANAGGKETPIGVWLDAEEGEFAGLSKTGRPQVKSTGSGTLAYRPGWHLGDIPRASQFDRTNKETGEKEFPKDFVWAECDYAMDIDYQPEADEQGYMRTSVDSEGNVITKRGDKYQHSLAGLKKLPKDGYYKYRTNPNPDTVPWVITGQMKVNRLLSDAEVNEILKQHGIAPIHRQGGDKTLAELGLHESLEEGYVKGALRVFLDKKNPEFANDLKELDQIARTYKVIGKQPFSNMYIFILEGEVKQELKQKARDMMRSIKELKSFVKFKNDEILEEDILDPFYDDEKKKDSIPAPEDEKQEALNEGAEEDKAKLIRDLRSMHLGDDWDTVWGDWELAAWMAGPYYVIQIDNDKENKHFHSLDIETPAELDREVNRLIGKIDSEAILEDNIGMEEMLVEDVDYTTYGYTPEECEAIKRIKAKTPNVFVPKLDPESGLPILPRSEWEGWEY